MLGQAPRNNDFVKRVALYLMLAAASWFLFKKRQNTHSSGPMKYQDENGNPIEMRLEYPEEHSRPATKMK